MRLATLILLGCVPGCSIVDALRAADESTSDGPTIDSPPNDGPPNDGPVVMTNDCSNPRPAPAGALAVGVGGTTIRWNGTAWELMTSASFTLRGVTVRSGLLAFGVGDGGAVVRWNGSMWNSEGVAAGPTLNDVWSVSDTEAWAVGDSGTTLHYTSPNWTPVSTPTSTALLDVWGFNENLFFAVGNLDHAVFLQGGNWQLVTIGLASNLTGMGGTSGDDVWFFNRTARKFHHWNGTVLEDEPVFGVTEINAIAGATPTLAWAVGPSGKIVRWDGAFWSPVSITESRIFFDVYATAADDAWAVGDGGMTYHFDGSGWCEVTSPTSASLLSVSAPP
jgi:hypothetical protein